VCVRVGLVGFVSSFFNNLSFLLLRANFYCPVSVVRATWMWLSYESLICPQTQIYLVCIILYILIIILKLN
jgi:hypothetical protein